MPDFKFVQNPATKEWVIIDPRRSKRPNVAKEKVSVCPFCEGQEKDEEEAYRVPSNVILSKAKDLDSSATPQNDKSDWLLRVVKNKFPFAPIHEIIIHSEDHHKNFGELPVSQVELIFQTFRQRFQTHTGKGQVYIFHNRGENAGESLPHPHTQLAVVPDHIVLQIPPLYTEPDVVTTKEFNIFCPSFSKWPNEVWVYPKDRYKTFGDITDNQITDISDILTRLVQAFDKRLGHEFPFNFYIYPGQDWYLRFIPRLKSLGGFEVGTGVFINSVVPKDLFAYLQKEFNV